MSASPEALTEGWPRKEARALCLTSRPENITNEFVRLAVSDGREAVERFCISLRNEPRLEEFSEPAALFQFQIKEPVEWFSTW